MTKSLNGQLDQKEQEKIQQKDPNQLGLEDAIQEQKRLELKNAVIFACEVERIFRLYGYHILSPEQFVEACKSIAEDMHKDEI